MNEYMEQRLTQELLECFELRFKEFLEKVRSNNPGTTSLVPYIKQDKKTGKIAATVKVYYVNGNKKPAVEEAVFEYRTVRGDEHWYCAYDWL
jgi:hypothetical protein